MSEIKTTGGIAKRRKIIMQIVQNNWQYFAAFLIPAVILLGVYFLFGVYPVGKRSVLSLDLNGQYVYYFDYMYDVFAGRESLIYSWSRNLSGEFLGIIGYYLASPFNFLVWVFPRSMITEGLLTMLVVKAGATGLSAGIYLRHGRGFSRATTIIFGTSYALCAYALVQTMNPMWLDGVFILPLVILGIEALVKRGNFRLFIISLMYAFVTCFYIGYMIGIFAALYFLYFLIAQDANNSANNLEEEPLLTRAKIVLRTGLFGISAACSALLSAFLLLPVVSSLSLGKFTFSTPDYTPRTNFLLIDAAAKLFPGSYDTVRMDGLPFLYCGVLAIIMTVCYFLSGKIPALSRKRRVASAALLLIMAVCMYITPVDMLWHGGQLPNWLPYRYSFIISFLLVIFGAEAFDSIKHVSEKLIAGAALGFAVTALFLETQNTFIEDLGNDGREVFDGLTVILPALLIIFIIAGLLVLGKHSLHSGGRSKLPLVTLTVFVCLELTYNALVQIVKQDQDIVYSSKASYNDVILPARKAVNQIKANDPGFYRIEKDFFRTVNDPLALDMYGLSHSSSTLNDAPIALLGKLGLPSRSHYTCYRGATPIVDDIFGVKYILQSPGNETGRITSVDDITYETNADAMPIAYLTSTMLGNLNLDTYTHDNINIFDRQNRIMSAMVNYGIPENYIRVIDKDGIYLDTENVEVGQVSGGHTSYKVVTPGSNAQLKYTLTAEATGELFMWLPSDYERKVNVWVNDTVWSGTYYETDYYSIKSLGVFEFGEELTVTLTLTRGDLYMKGAFFGYMDFELYDAAINKLHDMNANTTVTKDSPTKLTITTNSDEERTLFTTIPVEPGWTLTLDGVITPADTALGALICLKNLPAGAHTVTLTFTPGYYPLALYLTAGGIALFIIMCLIGWRVRKAAAPYVVAEAPPRFTPMPVPVFSVKPEEDEETEEEYETIEPSPADYDRDKAARDVQSLLSDILDINAEDSDDSQETHETPENPDEDTAAIARKRAEILFGNTTSFDELFPEDQIEQIDPSVPFGAAITRESTAHGIAYDKL